MLLRWDAEKPGQVRVMPTPMPTWDGVGYVPSYAVPTFRTGDPMANAAPAAPAEAEVPASAETIVATAQVDRRGRVRIPGRVTPGQEVMADLAGVSCTTRRSGIFRCNGRNLEPGQQVTIRLSGGSFVTSPPPATPPLPTPASGALVASKKASSRGRLHGNVAPNHVATRNSRNHAGTK